MPNTRHLTAEAPAPPADVVRRLDLVTANCLVEAVFQPIVDLRRGIVLGLEALCRPHPESGFVSAGALFNAAAEAGRLWEVERTARLVALRAAAAWKPGVLLFMNCSPQVFSDPRFAETLNEELVGSGGIPPGRVVLEITERSEAPFTGDLLAQAMRVKTLGCQIAIDDVGAGTSGLSRIMLLRPGWLKLDRELVASVHRDRVRQNLIRFMLHFGRLSGVQIVAEGIEEVEELGALVELGVGCGQGYFLGRPGEARHSVDAEVMEALRAVCPGGQGGRPWERHETHAGMYGRNALAIDGKQQVAEAATLLLRDPEVPGVAVTEGGKLIGWCGREDLLRAASDARAAQCVAMIARPCTTAPASGLSVLALLELAACREERAASGPLVLVEDDAPIAVLTIPDMLLAALEACRSVHARTAPLTGLPGRVCCDQHLAELMVERDGTGESVQSTLGYDAAVVDVRGFSAYNAAYGFDMGDALIQHLVSLLRGTVASDDPHTFLGHLGDDRFLVTALHGTLEMRLMRLVYRFDRTSRQFWCLLDGGEAAPDHTALPRGEREPAVGIRVLLVRDAIRRAGRPRDVLLMAERLRRTHGEQSSAGAACPGGSVLLADMHDDGPVSGLQRSA